MNLPGEPSELPSDSPAPNQVKLRRRRTMRPILAFIAVSIVLLIALKYLASRHPHFGRIYHTSAHDLNVARSNRLALFLSRNLPQLILQSRFYPERLKNQPKYLQIGEHQLEWSIGGPQTGWLYFWDIERMPRKYPWEFAGTRETNFLSISPSSIPSKFNGPVDQPVGFSTNAVKTSAGDILFARRNDETNKIYVLHLARQNELKLFVEYCITQIR